MNLNLFNIAIMVGLYAYAFRRGKTSGGLNLLADLETQVGELRKEAEQRGLL